MEKERVKEILNSKGFIEVRYKNKPVYLEGIGTDQDGKILVKDLTTSEKFNVDIRELTT
ncbi:MULTISPECIES: H-type small acid-soluble spore protein [Clostridium]|uniref:H-type small acid-soluble spore protein n=1 Tax=Clostridium TaxID=1485 RepID=UPI00069E1D4B|nr:H-type small acid-soluble spore protein [Clostridium sp. DMHC 10]KOF57359.1 spore protein [Clostridium sp. DMHC 10]MCD2348602.1 H-type small acid-soluble spore protein [Clostridium guangxiense]